MSALCQYAGCSGQIVDGFCEDCGRPAPAGSSGPASTPVTTGSSQTSGTSATSSSSSRSGRLGGTSSRRTSHGSGTGSGRALGGGMVMLPELPSQDPLLLVMADPVVPERKRSCYSCNAKVTREKGFCPNCGTEYNFTPSLKAGDVLVAQYEIKGPIAYGGLGWIYLGWDQMLSRWVVLKGLLNSKDEASAAAALAERQFLAAVKHPKIVGVYNFVTRDSEGYIVMEYVGGKTIKTLRQEKGTLGPEEAIAYIHGILPAFGYLHHQGLIYCDFKPDNFMLESDDVKLIDMGGVRRLDDAEGDIYGTKGYSAPEASEAPSITSDLFTIARTLAVLLFDFSFQSTYLYSLPPATEQPVLAEHPSLRRWLAKGMRQDPNARFQSAEEMADQLLGVLREVVSKGGSVKPAESAHFSGDTITADDSEEAPNPNRLPILKMDVSDPGANAVMSTVGQRDVQLVSSLTRIIKLQPDSAEARFRLVAAHIAAKRWSEAQSALQDAANIDTLDWRVLWYRSVLALLQHDAKKAALGFEAVMDEIPGEIAPRLAAAIAYEMANDIGHAADLYQRVLRVDPSFVSASFGLARCRMSQGNRTAAAEALASVPSSSSLFERAQITLTRVLLMAAPGAGAPGRDDLIRAGDTLNSLTIEGYQMHKLAADVFLTAIDGIEKRGIKPDPSVKVLGEPLEVQTLRLGAERALRAAARNAADRGDQIALIDKANSVRPWTLV